MNSVLESSIDSFINRASKVGAEGKLSTVAELDQFESRFPGLMPYWYREILNTKFIGDICFETEVTGLSWGGEGHIRDAATLLPEVEGAYPDNELAQNSYLVIGAAGDGDGWVIRNDSTVDSPVHLLQMSSYGTPDPRDYDGCLLQHGDSFGDFLDKLMPIAE